jgi:hypothetical protein
MYAENKATGGVMEPEGVLAVKFKPDGESCKQLQARLGIDADTAMRVALRFLELHDTSGRMLAKGVVKAVVPWSESRDFFISRLEAHYSSTPVQ